MEGKMILKFQRGGEKNENQSLPSAPDGLRQ